MVRKLSHRQIMSILKRHVNWVDLYLSLLYNAFDPYT